MKNSRIRAFAPIQEETAASVDLPMDWDGLFRPEPVSAREPTDSIPDGLIRSLSERGRVDIGYISAVTGADAKTIISVLKGSIYQNPQTWNGCLDQGWETSEEYLSGNLKRKWSEAKEAERLYPGCFRDNIRAIEAVLPPSVASSKIYITLGSPWVPADVIDDFIVHLFGGRFMQRGSPGEAGRVRHDELTGTWEVPDKNRYYHSIGVCRTYGTDRVEALDILEKTLNMKTVTVTDEVSAPNGRTRRVLNRAETVAALEKQKKLIRAFQKWVWQDRHRRQRLEEIYERRYACVRRRIFDGSFLEFPWMSSSVRLFPYQKNAVARILFTPNTLLAHDVGAGKTYVMIAAGQELKRMGLSAKNLYVVPNNIVGQWQKIFEEMAPGARLLVIEPKRFPPSVRQKMLGKIRDEDYDGIIMAYSCFEQIPLSGAYYREALKEQCDTMRKTAASRDRATSRLKKKLEKTEKELGRLTVSGGDPPDRIFFDQLGITRLFVDEAHNFKNVPLDTKADRILGISRTGSGRCRDMMDKVRLIQKNNGGGGVIFATGTPITNSVTDVFVLQQYLQSGELALLGLQNFDSWAGMFAERVTEFEVDVDTSGYRLATRFSRFHNLPELTVLLSSIADFHAVGPQAGIPETEGFHDDLLPRTPAFSAYLQTVSERADQVRNGRVDRKEDNMLKITSDGRKAALDLRLVDPQAPAAACSKAERCAENTAGIYFATMGERSAQLIFCDISTPKEGFNLYDEVKKQLIARGVPAEQIAFIHDAETERSRSRLFAKVRDGRVRILMGSTFKLGLGVNIQDRLIALHHLDVPWRPADMTQREGRILRQGNRNQKVMIFRYILEGSFDAYSWQLLETKQRFINGLLSGSVPERSGTDIEDTVLNYAEVKALAIGNPLVKERVEAANALERYRTLQRKRIDTRLAMEKELAELPARMAYQQERIRRCREDLAWCETQQELPRAAGDETSCRTDRQEVRRAVRQRLQEGLQGNILETSERVLGAYRGFRLVLPANMRAEKPYIWLVRSGRYAVMLGQNDTGNLIRIDNALDTMEARLDRLRSELSELVSRRAQISAELAGGEDYSDRIEACRRRVEMLDRRLGVQLQ